MTKVRVNCQMMSYHKTRWWGFYHKGLYWTLGVLLWQTHLCLQQSSSADEFRQISTLKIKTRGLVLLSLKLHTLWTFPQLSLLTACCCSLMPYKRNKDQTQWLGSQPEIGLEKETKIKRQDCQCLNLPIRSECKLNKFASTFWNLNCILIELHEKDKLC